MQLYSIFWSYNKFTLLLQVFLATEWVSCLKNWPSTVSSQSEKPYPILEEFSK